MTCPKSHLQRAEFNGVKFILTVVPFFILYIFLQIKWNKVFLTYLHNSYAKKNLYSEYQKILGTILGKILGKTLEKYEWGIVVE